MSDRLLTVADMAEMFGVTEAKILEWRRVYSWPHVRIGRQFRWTPEQVEAITRAHAVTPKRDAAKVSAIEGQTKRSAARAAS